MSIILDGTTGISSIGTLTGVSSVTFSNSSTTTVGALGDGQTWQSLIGSRALNTIYTNSTGKPIIVNISITTLSGTSATLNIENSVGGGSYIPVAVDSGATNISSNQSVIVPNGFRYQVITTGSPTLVLWSELR